jgi:hypothetical protein
MQLKDILSTKKRFNKLIDLLNKGSSIKLFNNHFIIKRKNNSLKMIETKNKENLVNSFLYKNSHLKNINKLEFSNFLIKEFILNNDLYCYVDEFVCFLNRKIHTTNYFKKCNKELNKFLKMLSINKDLNDFKYKDFLYLKTYPFKRWSGNSYLNYILPNINKFINKNYRTYEPFLLLIKCDLCKDIYDIIDFIDIKEEGLLFDKIFYEKIKHLKKQITNVNLCNNCYNHFLNKKELILKQAVNS